MPRPNNTAAELKAAHDLARRNALVAAGWKAVTQIEMGDWPTTVFGHRMSFEDARMIVSYCDNVGRVAPALRTLRDMNG